MDIMEMMRRAREMQEKASELQRNMASIEAEGRSGGGLVAVTLSAQGVLKRLSVDPSLLKPEEREILEDLIVAAHADAKTKLDTKLGEEMGRLTGKLGLPPGFGI